MKTITELTTNSSYMLYNSTDSDDDHEDIDSEDNHSIGSMSQLESYPSSESEDAQILRTMVVFTACHTYYHAKTPNLKT